MYLVLLHLDATFHTFETESYLYFDCRYRFNKNKFLTPPELHKHGIIKKEKSEVTLETEFEKIKKVRLCPSLACNLHLQNFSF